MNCLLFQWNLSPELPCFLPQNKSLQGICDKGHLHPTPNLEAELNWIGNCILCWGWFAPKGRRPPRRWSVVEETSGTKTLAVRQLQFHGLIEGTHRKLANCCLTLFTCALCSSLLSIVGLLGCRVEHRTLNYRQHPKHFPMSHREDVLSKLHLLPYQSKGRHQSAMLFGYENKSLKQRSLKLCVKTSATAAWRVWDRAETTWEEEFPICPM